LVAVGRHEVNVGSWFGFDARGKKRLYS